MIYVLTCPCGQVDYIGATSQSLRDRLISIHIFSSAYVCMFSIEHREHGDRIMHEFLLGQENITRDLPRPKSDEYVEQDC